VLAPIYRETLEKYYNRTFRDQFLTRLGSMVGVAVLTAYIGVWSPLWAALWVSVYVVSELSLIAWWDRIQPRLQSDDEADIFQLQTELIAISGVACAICVVPCFLTPLAGHNNQIVGVVLSAGVLLVIASAHSLRKTMFLMTAGPAVVALLWNLFSLGHGLSAWIYALVGLFYVINARFLQLSNSSVLLELIKLRLEAEAANTAKSEFLATMSHEIRTPLNGVLGMVQAMQRDDLPPFQRERLETIGQSGQTLLMILNDILDLSKIEAGKLELEEADFDLELLARGAHMAFAPMADGKDLRFTLEIETEALGTYRGDAVRVGQIIYNLISNAVKFTVAGSVGVSIDRSGETVRILVSDTGIGMSPDQIERLFDKFVQADSSTTRRFGGTGLGLSICRELCRTMGGEIRAHSELGCGSQFTVTLPLRRMTEVGLARTPKPAPEAVCDERSLRVLVAEDNTVNQLVLRALLGQAGIDPVIVGNGEEAVAAWERDHWDVILMDVQMPVMDGTTAARQIRRREAETGRSATPIIAVTANAMTHQAESYFAAGMNDFIAKPIEVAKLFDAIAAAVRDEPASRVVIQG